MAQGFDVTQSLFGNVLTPEQQATSAAMQQAQLGGLGGAEFQAFRAQESARQQIPKIFGQQSEDDIVKDVRNKNLPILQSQGKLAYLDAIIADFAARGLGNKAFLAQQLKDQVADAEQKRIADLGLTAAKTAESVAKADKASREDKKKPLQIDLGDRIEFRDPETFAVLQTVKKGLTPEQQRKAEAGAGEEKVGYQKNGSYRNQYGEVFTSSAMTKEKQGFKLAEDLLAKLNSIDYSDVVNAESIFDYAGGGELKKGIGGKVDPKTVAAQTKIAGAKLLEQIQKLPPGSASDADMRAAVQDFPGYGNVENLKNWVNRTKAALQASLDRQTDQYGFRQRVQSTGDIGPKKTKAAQQQPTQGVPAGVDPAVWAVMTPQEKALWK